MHGLFTKIMIQFTTALEDGTQEGTFRTRETDFGMSDTMI